MKKALILLALLLSALGTQAQVSLEKEIPMYTYRMQVAPGEWKLAGIKDDKLYVYNIDNFQKELEVDVSRSGFKLNSVLPSLLSKRTFNTDDKYEFIIGYTPEGGGKPEYKLMDESGWEMYDFGNYSPGNVFRSDGKTKLLTSTSSGGEFTTRIYTLSGDNPVLSIRPKTETDSSGTVAYPVPASAELRVQGSHAAWGQLQVLDMQGRVLASGKAEEGVTLLDIQALPAGTYIYRFSAGPGAGELFIKE